MEFSGVIIVRNGDVHAKGQGQKSKVKNTEVKTKFAPIWAFPDCNSSVDYAYEMMHKAWSGMEMEELPYCFPMSPIKFLGHRRFWPELSVSGL